MCHGSDQAYYLFWISRAREQLILGERDREEAACFTQPISLGSRIVLLAFQQ